MRVLKTLQRMASASAPALQRLEQRAVQAEQLINQLRAQLQALRDAAVAKACQEEEEKLRMDNARLAQDVERLRSKLVELETRNGVKQVAMPQRRPPIMAVCPPAVCTPPPPKQAKVEQPQKVKDKPAEKEKKDKSEAKPKAAAKGGAEDKPIDVSRLNMKIGKIVDVKRHPDADTLYVEQVEVGEDKPRTVVSGLVNHVPIEQMQNRIAIFMLNLKPAKMRGIFSEGMIMCGSTPEKVEIIVPPEGVQIGQSVTVEGYSGTPDPQLNPKKKVWEQVQPDLRIDNQGAATYKGARWTVEGQGPCSVPTMRDTPIK